MVTVKTTQRETKARLAIHKSLNQIDHGIVSSLFVKYHVNELDSGYWLEHLGTATPNAKEIIDLLELCPSCSENDQVYEFTLPGNISEHQICVHFDVHGEVDDISIVS